VSRICLLLTKSEAGIIMWHVETLINGVNHMRQSNCELTVSTR
jgi:hypothetical protein